MFYVAVAARGCGCGAAQIHRYSTDTLPQKEINSRYKKKSDKLLWVNIS